MRNRRITRETSDHFQKAQLERVNNPDLADVIERNIAAIIHEREEFERSKSPSDRMADAINAFAGSMPFVYFHIAWFAIWIGLNTHLAGLKPFDPFPFGLLTMIVSLEAIFLATFILVSQNRMQLIADRRADLDLQINLLAEHEITRVLSLVDAIADKMGIVEGQNPEIDELEKDVSLDAMLKEMDSRHRSHPRPK